MGTRRRSRNWGGLSGHTLSALLAVLLTCAGAKAQVTTVVEAGGQRVELSGGDVRCVLEESGLHCKASPQAEKQLSAPEPLGGTASVTAVRNVLTTQNLSTTSVTFIFVVTLPRSPAASTLMGGSVGGSVTDSSYDGTGGLGTSSGTPLYQALIDGAAVASLKPDPTNVPGSGFPGTFAFAGASVAVPAASFGLPGPSQAGPAVVSSIGIRISFQLAAGDSAAFTSVFGVLPDTPGAEAPPNTSEGQAALGSEAEPKVVRVEQSLSGEGADIGQLDCPRVVSGSIAVTNGSVQGQFIFTFTLPVSPLPGTLVGGSIAGSVTDIGFDGTGGISTTATTPLFAGRIDGVDVPGTGLYPPAFSLPGPAFPGTFSSAGDTVVLPGSSFGLPGPTTNGPPVTSNIGIRIDLLLAPFDTFALTSLFVVDCGPTPTMTPTMTPTATPTATPTNTPTPVPQGGLCSEPEQCAAGLFCSRGVCCDAPCDGALERCYPQAGTCTDLGAAPAPAASHSGLLVALGALLGVAALAFRRARR